MKFLDLSTKASSKRYVDFNDVRYQGADRLKPNMNKAIRATFSLYDNKEAEKMTINDIKAAYSLSDKHLPLGELLNKILDLIVDMEDGTLNSEKDVIYAWKFSNVLIEMLEDKENRQETLSAFDNSLKNLIVNSASFREKYPGKYTTRTNFFDEKLKKELISDIRTIFKEIAIPKLHSLAIAQSKIIAEKHSNPIIDSIANLAQERYGCLVDSYYDIKEEQDTNLFYSINTIILHFKNGYDMSIVGYAGTDRDEELSFSVFNANNASISNHAERITKESVENTLKEVVKNTPVNPLISMLKFEEKKHKVLKEQYDILAEIRPMIDRSLLELPAAINVVGKDYLWACKQFRENHEDLPKDFKLEDVHLPPIPIEEEFSPEMEEIDNDKVVEEIEYTYEESEEKKDDFDFAAIMLPNSVVIKKKESENIGPSITSNAQQVEKEEELIFKDLELPKREEPKEEIKEEPKEIELNLDALFDN